MIDLAVLADFVLSALPAAEHARVEALVAASPALQAAARELAALFTEDLDVAPVTPAPGGRDRLLAAITPRGRLAAFVERVASFVGLTRDAAAALLATIDDADRFAPSPWPGIGLFHIEPGPRYAGAEVGFVRMAPGTVFPHHGHAGTEINLILQGRLRLDDGTVLAAGDTYGGDAAVEHHFVALDGPDLILVAVLQGDLVFSDA